MYVSIQGRDAEKVLACIQEIAVERVRDDTPSVIKYEMRIRSITLGKSDWDTFTLPSNEDPIREAEKRAANYGCTLVELYVARTPVALPDTKNRAEGA